MSDQPVIKDLDDAGRRGVNSAAALAREQLKYAQVLAQEAVPPGTQPDPQLLAALLAAIASNYAAVK
ncbi:MAG: hypothetical protein JWP65_1070 [Ramlibacter sp.]|jgi:hypothetical protein|uniref:hypothetical protein n=1 Tax=Ramlibacter sp. TaxID=1917967 RepID=UPI00260ABE42|nr:hypothetical protein [Ramlibacter sp.]MDB5750649.1 hypothetical protein [Ramlibacter sp.]